MSLLQNMVSQIVQNAIKDSDDKNDDKKQIHQKQAGQMNALSDLLGSVLGNSSSKTSSNHQASQSFGLDDILGNVFGVQSRNHHKGHSNDNSLLALLGGFLGGQAQAKNISPTDLGGVLSALLGSGVISPNPMRNRMTKSKLLLALLPMILAYIQANGGLSGLLEKFNQSGMADKARSFVNQGANEPMDGAQVERLFEQNDIMDICQKTGASKDEVCQGIAELLPQLVNELTPNGSVNHDEKQANSEISAILQQFSTIKT